MFCCVSNPLRTFSPVPKRIQDGSEDVFPAATISGAPMELQARTVRLVSEPSVHEMVTES
jgi:NADH dehydrogenase (ubiquinone) Fe-S protein 4